MATATKTTKRDSRTGEPIKAGTLYLTHYKGQPIECYTIMESQAEYEQALADADRHGSRHLVPPLEVAE